MVRSFLRILLRLPGLQVPEMVLADRSHPYLTFATQIHTGPADRLHRQRGAYLLHLLLPGEQGLYRHVTGLLLVGHLQRRVGPGADPGQLDF